MKDLLLRAIHRLARFLGIRPQAPLPVGPSVVTEVLAEDITVLAQGDVFAFQVALELTWGSADLDETQLRAAMAEYRGDARARVGRRVAGRAHHAQPDRVFELEQEVNAELARADLAYAWDDATIRCTPQVRVGIDRKLREALREPLLRRIVRDCQHEYDMHQVELLNELAGRWSEVLEKLHDLPFILHAAQLTEEQFAKTIGQLSESRQRELTELTELHTLLQAAIKDGTQLGIGGYEWAETFDRTLQSYIRAKKLDHLKP
jgi:hypothetical protein